MSSMLFRRAAAPAASAVRAFSTSTPRAVARINILGNLADTPEVVTTNSGRELVKYSVASNSGPRDNRHTSWFRVTCFIEGPRKDFLLSLPKGSTVYVEADAQSQNYQDANGQQRTGFNFVHRNLELVRRPANSYNNAESSHAEGQSEGQGEGQAENQ